MGHVIARAYDLVDPDTEEYVGRQYRAAVKARQDREADIRAKWHFGRRPAQIEVLVHEDPEWQQLRARECALDRILRDVPVRGDYSLAWPVTITPAERGWTLSDGLTKYSYASEADARDGARRIMEARSELPRLKASILKSPVPAYLAALRAVVGDATSSPLARSIARDLAEEWAQRIPPTQPTP